MRKVFISIAACAVFAAAPAFAQTAGNSGNLLAGAGGKVGGALSGPGAITRPVATSAANAALPIEKDVRAGEQHAASGVDATLNGKNGIGSAVPTVGRR